MIMNETPATTTAPMPEPQRLGIIASQGAGWMKFLGVVSILEGALAALTIVGILFAWLPIWLGLLLFKAAEDAEIASKDDPARLEPFIKRLNKYFMIQGIVTLLGLVAGAIFLFSSGMAFLAGLAG
jgi:hypothetical protein